MDDKPYKPPPSATQFGELQESHSTLEGKHVELTRRFDKQDKKLLDLEAMGRIHGKQIEGQSRDLQANTQATNRIEKKTDDISENSKDLLQAFDAVKKTFTLLEWVVKRLLPVLGGLAAVGAWWFKH